MSALLIGALAFTGCGANPEKAQEAAASASASVAQANLNGVQTLADDYATAMTDVDPTALESALSADEQARFTEIFSGADRDIETVADLEQFFSELSPEDQDLLRKVVSSDSLKIHDLIDYSDMDDNKKLTLDFLNFILVLGFTMDGTEISLDNNKINLDELSLDGTQVEIPVKALAETDSATESMKDFFNHIPVRYVDGAWKINGNKYLEKMDSISYDS
ncbi:hypothetical protein ACN082_08125 [Rothia sp. CCM 9417]|uniref:hypothetical protein n=1 Tax=Rothia sp. CCM 9417 TaxID=3402657 RepID=UPI003AE2E96E